MQFSISTQPLKQVKTDCLIVPIDNKTSATALQKQLGAEITNSIQQARKIGDLQEFKQHLLLVSPAELTASRILIINCGESSKLTYSKFKSLLRNLFHLVSSTDSKSTSMLLDKISVTGHDGLWTLRQAVTLFADFAYRFTTYKSEVKAKPLTQLSIIANKTQASKYKLHLQHAVALTNGINFTKNLGNTPPNIATPRYLSQQAKELCKNNPKLSYKIHGEKDLKRLKMGALLAVGTGSQHESQLIEVHYKGARRKQAPVVLVGKGVTFDTGGISLKPGPGMDEMKYDMCGAATVLGTIKAIAEARLPLDVIGVIPSVENMPDGTSYKPGDVITSMSGQTIEVLNTDAEGRLILCDALTYAQKTFKPSLLIDMATLTGAMVMSLGTEVSGFFSTSDAIAKQMEAAAKNSRDDAWRMPFRSCYVAKTDSKIADMRNIGPRWGGACIAAGFLSRFVDEQQTWVHMDIAGTAYTMGNSIGGTGRPVPLLVEFLQKLKL